MIAQNRQSYAATTTGSYQIAGVLVNAATGEPVRRASVEVLNVEDSHAVASCRTDNDGRFVLDHLAEAKYQLTASKRGFRTAFYDEHDEFSSAIVTGQNQDTTHLQFRLTPDAVVHGVVTADGGEPVMNGRVMLFKRPKHPDAAGQIQAAGIALTNDIGEYEFGDLASGEYMVAVVAEPWYAVHEGAAGKQNPALDVAFPVTYFDSTAEEQSATPIEVTGGSREEANISLHAVPALHLTISVPRKADGSLARPELQHTVFGNVIGAESAGFIDAMQTGSVEMTGIAPGIYELSQGDPPRVLDLNLASSLQVDPNAGSATNAVAGRVRMASGVPAADQMTVTLQRVGNGPGLNQYATGTDQGHFGFDAVPAGEWQVWVTSGDKLLPVLATGSGTVQRAGNIITLREHAPELVITVSQAETLIEGFAQKDGKGLAAAMIVLLPRNAAQWKALTRRDQSDSDGSFALKDVAPGQYRLVAIEDGWPLDWTSPAAMARFLPAGTNVTVTESSGQLLRLSAPVVIQER